MSWVLGLLAYLHGDDAGEWDGHVHACHDDGGDAEIDTGVAGLCRDYELEEYPAHYRC